MSEALRAALAAAVVVALPLFTSWAQALSLALVSVVVGVALWLYRHRGDRHTGLDSQPLLPGEARWVVARDGTILDSCVHERETGIATGWAVGHPISTWAPPGTPEAEHYRRAMEDRRPVTFESRFLDPTKREHVARTALVPRSDGTVYGESWDVTEYVRARDDAEAARVVAEERYADLQRFVGEDFDRWAADRVATTSGQ